MHQLHEQLCYSSSSETQEDCMTSRLQAQDLLQTVKKYFHNKQKEVTKRKSINHMWNEAVQAGL